MPNKRPIRTMIVDDEEGGRHALQDILSDDPQLEVIAVAKDGREALRMIEKLKPDLVFMDIDMPHLSGIDVARNLRDHRPLIIFATAFAGYAINAFEVNAVDYILKPFTKERVAKSLVRARALLPRKITYAYERYVQSNESFAHARKISFIDSNELLIMDMDGISCIETEERYVRVFHDGTSHLLDESLTSIYARLDKTHFVFASRASIVNLAHVKNLVQHGLRKFSVIVDDPPDKDIALSRNRVDEIRQRLKAVSMVNKNQAP